MTGIGDPFAADFDVQAKDSCQSNNATTNKDQWRNFEPPRDEKHDWIQQKDDFQLIVGVSYEF